jgi:hypothetical protein
LTASQIITRALQLIGVLASGESLGATDGADALVTLNNMIDSWSNEQLLIPAIIREVFPLVVGQQTYAMGPAGTGTTPDFITSRPQRIENALLQYSSVSPVMEIPMQMLNQDEYANVLIKSLSSTIPLNLYVDGSYPLNNLNVWPVPQVAYNIVLYSWKPLANIASLTTAVTVPPGYLEAIEYSLAIRLASPYGKQVPEVVAAVATDSKATIKRMNIRPVYLRVDKAIVSRPAVWDWRTGGYTP